MSEVDPALHVVALVYELFILAISLFIGHQLIQRYKTRRNKTLLFLMSWGTFLLLCVLFSVGGRVLRITGWRDLSDGRRLEFLALTVTCILAGAEFLMLFILDVFHGGIERTRNKQIAGVYGIGVAAAIIYVFASGALFTEDVTVTIWILVNVVNGVVFAVLIKDAYSLLKRLGEDRPVERVSTKMILGSPAILIMVYLFFLVDRILGGRYSPFYYIAWATSLVAIVMLYIGYLQPDWVKRRVMAKHAERQKMEAEKKVSLPVEVGEDEDENEDLA